jgi:hypothetical protein
MTVYQLGHHFADLAAAIAAAETTHQLLTHATRGLEIHAVHNTEEKMKQYFEALVGGQLGNSGQGFFEKLFAIGVRAHEREAVKAM